MDTGKAWQRHSKYMTTTFMGNEMGNDIAKTWNTHSKDMAKAWQQSTWPIHSSMAKTWQRHGKRMANTVQVHGGKKFTMYVPCGCCRVLNIAMMVPCICHACVMYVQCVVVLLQCLCPAFDVMMRHAVALYLTCWCLVVAMRVPCRCCHGQRHGKYMARTTKTWQKHGEDRAKTWQRRHGKDRARAWQRHGKDMAKTGQQTWRRHSDEGTTHPGS
jgi:hypothetical protein